MVYFIIHILGQWESGVPHGKGLLFNKFGGLIKTTLTNGVANGQLYILYPNKDQFKGFCSGGELSENSLKTNFETHEYTFSTYNNGFETNNQNYKSHTQEAEHKLPQIIGVLDEVINIQHLIDNQNEQEMIGIFLLQNNDIFVGKIENLLPNSLGLYIKNNGNMKQIGGFENGMLQNRGRTIFTNGDIYDGNFVNGLYEHTGVYFNNQDKTWFFALFHRNEILTTIQFGYSDIPACLDQFESMKRTINQNKNMIEILILNPDNENMNFN